MSFVKPSQRPTKKPDGSQSEGNDPVWNLKNMKVIPIYRSPTANTLKILFAGVVVLDISWSVLCFDERKVELEKNKKHIKIINESRIGSFEGKKSQTKQKHVMNETCN